VLAAAWFAGTDSTGSLALLPNAVGSTIALVNSSRSIATQDDGACPERSRRKPFGKTTTSGASTTNPCAFAGRELDTSGLYFMRARYYNPLLSRFISQDPLGNTTYLFDDAAGRLIWKQDPLGNQTNLSYSPLDDLTQIMDEDGNLTRFEYDTDRGLTSVTDANANQTIYTYDPMDRRISRKDALGATETYAYDGNGNLTQHTDRNGNVTQYQYDGLNHRTFAGFGYNGSTYQSSITYAWDGGNRLTAATDSIAGTIARTYEGLDRLTDEQTPQGEVSYSYDNANRRSTMTVAGQTQESYAWDNANRLTGITQGSGSVAFQYDNANRRTQLTLPNGIVVAYTYDNDSHVTGMTWTLTGNQIGDLEYSYDADGHIIEKTGSMAATNLPQAVAGNTFNADNEMTAFNGIAMTYDANGNLISDGTNAYAWDARNHLSGITGAVAASFVYGPFGRRVSKTINGTATAFLYDGPNPVQELQNGSPSANMLTGLGIDEYFQRSDSGGVSDFLTDALGTTVALADSSGAIQTSYTYEPFGNTTVSGASSTNPFQFTGRENDATGLYYNRARYYSPMFQRFIGQDPIGFASGDSDLYRYVNGNPVSSSDATGLETGWVSIISSPPFPAPEPTGPAFPVSCSTFGGLVFGVAGAGIGYGAAVGVAAWEGVAAVGSLDLPTALGSSGGGFGGLLMGNDLFGGSGLCVPNPPPPPSPPCK
jgi:RHS repeat-associated protein